MKIQSQPNPPLPPKAKPPAKPEHDKLVSDWVVAQRDDIAAGTSLVVDLGDGRTYRVEGTKLSPTQRSLGGIKDFVTAATQEIQAAIQAGPNLALLGATQVIKPMVLSQAPYEVGLNIDQWYQPGLQGVSVALSVVNFIKKYKEHEERREIGQKSSFIQKIGLAANAGHVLTSTVGLAGIAGAAVIPSLRAHVPTAMGIAIAGSVLAFGANYLEYFADRGDNIMPLDDVKKPK